MGIIPKANCWLFSSEKENIPVKVNAGLDIFVHYVKLLDIAWVNYVVWVHGIIDGPGSCDQRNKVSCQAECNWEWEGLQVDRASLWDEEGQF